MADSNTAKRAEQDNLAEDDPFAELTRIMGYESDAAEPGSQEPGEDLALDLEKELMGDIPDGSEDNSAPRLLDPETVSWSQGPQAAIPESEPEPQPVDPDEKDPLAAALEEALYSGEALDPATDGDESEQDVFSRHSDEQAAASAPEDQPPLEETAPTSTDGHGQGGLQLSNFRAIPTLAADSGFEEPQQDYQTAYSEPPASEDTEPRASEHQPGEPESEAPPVDEVIQENQGVQGAQDAWQPVAFEPDAAEQAHAGPAEPHQEEHGEPEPDEDEVSFDYAKAAAERHDLLSAEELSAGLTDFQTFEPDATSQSADDPQPVLDTGTFEDWHALSADDNYADAPSTQQQSEPQPPAIETVDVPERAVPLTDDLDVPDVSYREDVKPAAQFDEIEEILAGAFGESTSGAGNDTDKPSGEASQDQDDTFLFEDEQEHHYAAAGGIAAGAAAAGFADRNGDAVQSAHHDDWIQEGWNGEGQQASLSPEPGVQPPVEPRGSRSRWLAAAAVLGGVVILGGVTVYALNFGDSDGGGPVLVSADNSPVKIKPEDPGGVDIPNQDSQVYRRVSGEQTETKPAQANLVSTTEDPVDLPAPSVGQNEPASAATEPAQTATSQEEQSVALAPPAEQTDTFPSGESDASAPASAGAEANVPAAASSDAIDAELAKIEDRLSSTESEDAGGNTDVVSLTPRRVRSLVVRPDGSMVPNDMPVQKAEVVSDNPGAQDSASEEAGASAAAIPQTGPIPPSRPANIAAVQPQSQTAPASTPSQQPTQQQPAQQQPAEQQPAQPAAAAPAQQQSGGSPWSVQIASQPTVEGAQQSYQQLAQRFGNVLQGKGVNIVKADIEGRGTFYRVRIPSSSKDEAIQLCSQLKSAGGSCFVSQ